MRLSARAVITAMTKPANLLASVALAMCITSENTSVSACDQCDSMAVACDSCSSRGSMSNRGGAPDGPIFKALDAFAGGIEKLAGLDKCGSAGCGSGGCGCDAGPAGCDAGPAGCDDACGSAMIQELSAPIHVPSRVHSHAPAPTYAPAIPHTVTPHYNNPVPATEPRMPTVPPETYSAPIDAGSTRPYVEQPLVPVPADEAVAPDPGPGLPTPDPAPTRTPDPSPAADPPAPQQDRSIFDSLDDPFGDDEVRVHPKNRTIRTAAHRAPVHQHRTVAHQHAVQPKKNLLNNGGLLGQLFGTRQTTPTQKPAAVRHAHQPVVRHQVTHRHVAHSTTHQHAAARTVQRAAPVQANQVRLRKAPAANAAPAPVQRQYYGQRHTTLRTSAYGHTTNR